MWERTVGSLPATDEHRPRERVRRQAGPVGDANLELRLLPVRLDWMLSPAIADGTVPASHFGTIENAIAQFDGIMKQWLRVASDLSVMRMAVGVIAVLPVPDRTSAYEKLQAAVPSVKFDANHSREVLYQINRPVVSRRAPGLELNRITTWNAIVSKFLMISGGVPPFSGQQKLATEEQYVRCECDHSTPADRTDQLENALLLPIYEELMSLAVENLERGEIP